MLEVNEMARIAFCPTQLRRSGRSRVRAIFGIVSLIASTAFAQSTPDAAFQAGKDFAGNGKNSAAGAINSTTGKQNLPFYNTNAPESSDFGNGMGAVGAAGSQKQITCQSYKAGSAFDQQECDAVNFMTRNPGERQKFKIDKNKDPLMTGSKNLIANPGTAQGSDTQQCHVEQTKIPGKTTTETCSETQTLGDQSCQKVLSVDVQMSCQPAELFQALDLPRNEVDHVKIFAKCDPAAQSHSYIEMTADAFGIRGGTVRNATVQVPKDVASIPASSWTKTVGGPLGYLLVMTHPDWSYAIRDVPVYILNDSTGCQPGTDRCAYHIYWEWTELMNVCDINDNCPLVPVLQAKNDGWATGVIQKTSITDHWDNQCLYLDSRSQ
jgi:hypothetical protein